MRFLLEYNGIESGEGPFYLMLATDDAQIVNESIVQHGDGGMPLHFLWNPYAIEVGKGEIGKGEIGKGEGVQLQQRRTHNALRSIVFDILLLSDSDMFVGQDGSRVARLVLELMAMRVPDYKQKMLSLDALVQHQLDFPYWVSAKWLK